MLRRFLPILILFTLYPAFSQDSFFWDNPVPFSAASGAFPQAASTANFAITVWQENSEGNVYISLATKDTNVEKWSIQERIAGPFPYLRDDAPSIFTLFVDKGGQIFICVASSTTQTTVFTSRNKARSFESYIIGDENTGKSSGVLGAALNEASNNSLVPRIYQSSDGTYLMFLMRSVGATINIFYSRSNNGVKWQDFRPFVNEPFLRLNFLPSLISIKKRDFVVFQSFVPGSINRPGFQLYFKTSDNGGRSWSAAQRITNFMDAVSNTGAVADSFTNERAHLSIFEDKIFMVWERRYLSNPPSIYGVLLDNNGNFKGNSERISSSNSYCNNPIGITFRGARHVFWFDNRNGNYNVFLGTKSNDIWENRDMARLANNSIFPRPVQLDNKLYVFWQEIKANENKIFYIAPDANASAPEITPLNFTAGKNTSSDIARISWNIPYDTSGIEAFSWVWTRNPAEDPPKTEMGFTSKTNIEEVADADGEWYFKIRAKDFAGNWSSPSQVVFVRDKTPPPQVQFLPLPLDDDGFVVSNDFTFKWLPPPSSDIAGFSWNLTYGDNGFIYKSNPIRIMGKNTEVSYSNEDNGYWHFTVYAIDNVGNVGPGAVLNFKANKYVPHTFITFLENEQDLMGDLNVRIIGRGFTENGNIYNISFVLDGEDTPTRSLSASEYKIRSDREIILNTVENLLPGSYYISVEHPLRGIARSPHTISVGRSLTYKFGNYTEYWKNKWESGEVVFDGWMLALGLFLALCVTFLIIIGRSIAFVLSESRAIRLESEAIIKGTMMPLQLKNNISTLKRRGSGLRLKLVSFTVAIVIIVVAMVSTPLYIMMTRSQENTLRKSLWDRSTVLMESISTSARAFLPSNNVLELGFLPAQAVAVPEAKYLTISGFGTGSTTSSDYVWASNDPDVLSKINTPEFEAGVSRISDNVSEFMHNAENTLNSEASKLVGDAATTVAALNRDAQNLLDKYDNQSMRELADIQMRSRALDARITSVLNDLDSVIYSEPNFDNLNTTDYILFKPVLFRQSNSDIYVRGWVRLEISSESIITKIKEEQRTTLTIILFIALIAIAIGAVGAVILATLIISPIHKLVSHVERIRDADDKSELSGIEIITKTHDEIEVLGDTINDMTHGLVKAALASKDLLIGKEIQKKFIPLELDKEGNKLTTGYKNTKNVEFFGYYEGAKGVSGDYFDYRDLDGRYFAIIKCDVAGKGIPAALIMIQVATIFISFFRNWKPNADGMHIERLVYEINDFIEQLGFKGRFAAFTLCLLDSETGLVRFCNAGDNLIHFYDNSDNKVKVLTLPQTPATGVLPNILIGDGYKVQTLNLDKGDMLLLYTDGIEEAKRKFRDINFAEIVCNEGENGTEHENHVSGQDSEEMGVERVEAIINAVMNKKVYSLVKYHNPLGNITYNFDFSNCNDTVEDVTMALVSVEKIFRMFQDTTGNKILVDKKVDAFLKEHFEGYEKYCRTSGEISGYLYYSGVKEDEQYDDLTILGVKRI